MVSIIKNQLLKHLSRYTKNLSSDKINLSTFRGEGELSNLQLDEDVLTDLLELPLWLRLTSAWCNHVSFRISWTKLKSVPITLSLDEVHITVETCEFGRTESGVAGLQTLSAPQGKYSFIHKVIDGITIVVNTVIVNFKSPAFTASVQMSRIRVESKTPKWLTGDLRFTRLKDPQKGLLLIFKELSWQTVRIEASSTQDTNLTPLRLLTNQARCRIKIKKKLSDCSILTSSLVLILDDLLWVLTDSQLKAALHFVDSLASLIKASNNLTQKTKAKKMLEQLPEYHAQVAQQSRHQQTQNDLPAMVTAAQKLFNSHDVKETSYHFFSQRIDLHLCDDAGDGRSCYPELRDGGALQISVQGFQVDYYPFHLARSDRSHWPKYKQASAPPALWLQQSLDTFRESLLDLCQPNRSPAHAPLERQPQVNDNINFTNSNSNAAEAAITKQIIDNLYKLMTSCVVLRIEDFTLYRVTTSGKKQMPKEFISGDKDRYSFPAEMSTIHAEFTYFYFPGDFVFPLPPSKAYIHVNPVQINFHLDSLLWLNSFALNLHESLLRTTVASNASTETKSNEPSLMYMDVKMEAIMPRVIIEAAPDAPTQRDRPKTMQIQVSRFALTNIRETGSSRADLANALHSLQEGSLVFASGFPSKMDDLCVVTDRILSHVSAADVTSTRSSPDATTPSFSRYALWVEPRDVWCIKLDPIWIDFLGARSVGQNKSVPFFDAVPITFWIHGRSEGKLNLNNCNSGSIASNSILSLNQQQQQQRKDHRSSASSLQPSIDDKSLYEENANSSTLFDPYLGQPNYIDTNPFYNNLINEDSATSDSESATIHAALNKRAFDANESPVTTTTTSDVVASADLHVIAHVANLVSVQIDHYQYLFLLRLAEEMTELSTFLSLDAKRIMHNNDANKSIVIGCVIPQVEVTLVMPSQTPGKESSGDVESVLPDSASLGDDLQINNSGMSGVTWGGGTTNMGTNGAIGGSTGSHPLSLDQLKNNQTFGSIETPSPITNEAPDYFPQLESHPNTHGYNVQIVSTPSSITTPTMPPSSVASNQQVSSRRNRNSITDTGLKDIGSSLSSMKKGFSNFMTSIDSALKNNPTDDMSDTISIKSDISSDSENFMMVMADDKVADCMEVMFRLNPFTSETNQIKVAPVEVASEVCEEADYKTNMSSPSEPSEGSTWRRRDLVSMATFRLTTVEIIRQNRGHSSSIRLQVSALSCNECGAIPWDELQTKFEARCRAWNIAPYNPEAPPSIQLRLEEELIGPPIDNGLVINDKKDVLGWFKHKADIRVKDLDLDLSMSTIIGLGDLAEDEVISKPLPMEVSLENVGLTIMEDRPPVNITSPGPVPINLKIGKMRIKRDLNGIFQLQPENEEPGETPATSKASNIDELIFKRKDRDRELISLQLVMQQLKIDNENLKKQINNIERDHEQQKAHTQQENDVLKSYLKRAQDDVTSLLDEKRTLLETVRSLQFQMGTSEKHLKNDGNR